jgi:periplasmic divalent cation tolerance protein
MVLTVYHLLATVYGLFWEHFLQTRVHMRILLTTAPPDKAEQIVEKMVADRWVACGNILPSVHSIYRWKGEICREPESMIIMETKAEKSTQAMKFLQSIHPYEVPKIISLRPDLVQAEYLNWVLQETHT